MNCCGEETVIHVLPMKPLGVVERSKTIEFCKTCGGITETCLNTWTELGAETNINNQNK